ncbi:pyridoxal phosphate-dependent aminotransferase [Actinokineospora sp. NPDC004072]
MPLAAPEPRPWLAASPRYRSGSTAAPPAGRLASNESPSAPAWLGRAAAHLADLDVHRYPDAGADRLRAAVAAANGVDPDEVVVGNGSDELIHLLIQAYAAYTGGIVTAAPGYALYGMCARRLGAAVTEVPLVDWRHDLAAMAAVPADLAFIANPHNPTGTVVSPDALAEFIETSQSRAVVVDEAYIDFTTGPRLDTATRAVREPRVVVVRTFSKAHALAGVRLGYLIAHRDIAAQVERLRLPFSVSALAQHLGVLALAHTEETAARVREIVERREELTALLRAAGLEPVESQGNFILVLTPASDLLVKHLADAGIAARPGRDLGIPDAVRLTIPSADGMTRLEPALRTWTAR